MPSVFARAVRAAQNAAREGDTWAQAALGRTVVVVQMAGGNDGLNTIVPYTDPNYKSARPTLALGANQVIDLNGRLGFHPALAALQPLWSAHKLAVVEGVGYPNSSLSHFTAMDIWQTVDVDGQGRSTKGGWLGNYTQYPWMLAAPVLAFGGGLLALAASRAQRAQSAFLASCGAVAGVVLTAGFALFPFIMPSSSDPRSSLTVYDAVSSQRTLQIMFWVTVVFVPLIALYTSWVYAKLRGTITLETIRSED